MADDADTHEKDVEEIDERMQKLTHKLENARRDFVRGAGRRENHPREFHVPQDHGRRHGGVPGRAVRERGMSVSSPPPRPSRHLPQLDAHSFPGRLRLAVTQCRRLRFIHGLIKATKNGVGNP